MRQARHAKKSNRSFAGTPAVLADPFPDEPRMRAIGKTTAGRHVFVVFMIRTIEGFAKLRPISARYMHQKEIEHYERQRQAAAVAAQR